MEGSMFCNQCQEAFGNKGCTTSGRCGETSETANLQDRLIAELKAVALTLEGRTNVTREFSRFIVRAMSATLTDTNFNPDRIYSLIDEAKRALRTLDSDIHVDPSLLSVEDPEERAYCDLLMCGLKGVCAFAFHALALGYEDNAIYNFIIKVLAATAKPDTPHERLALLIVECGRIASIAMALLDEANTETYGSPTICHVSWKAAPTSHVNSAGSSCAPCPPRLPIPTSTRTASIPSSMRQNARSARSTRRSVWNRPTSPSRTRRNAATAKCF